MATNVYVFIENDNTLYCKVPDLAVVPGINASAVLWEVSVTMNCQHYFTSGLVYNLYNLLNHDNNEGIARAAHGVLSESVAQNAQQHKYTPARPHTHINARA